MTDKIHTGTVRVDALAKVTGAPIYGADRLPDGTMHAVFAVSKIAKGRVTAIALAQSRNVAGVRAIYTHEDTRDDMQPGGFLFGDGYAFQSFTPMLSDVIAYKGQPIAMVVAETIEAANYAASLIDADYEVDVFSSSLSSEGTETIPQAQSPLPQQMFGDTVAGDALSVFEAAATTIDATFHSPPQHQNPMELIATVAIWDGDQLTIYEGTQNAAALKFGVAQILGLDPEQVTVRSPHAGGGFGQKNSQQTQTAFVAWAAREIGAPVKMVVPRGQLFHSASFRAESLHRIRLGADRDGRMTSILYDVDAQTSRHDLFPLDYTNPAAHLYGIENFRGFQRLVRTDVQTPGYMRAPFEHVASLVVDTAVDELAHLIGQDPVAFRMAHDTATDPITGLPLSSRGLNACLRRGAEMFDWSRRLSQPGSMTTADGQLLGLGVGCGCYKANTAAAIATLRVNADGTCRVSVGVHEMGQGVRTAIADIVTEKLGVPADRIEAIIGDTTGVPQHLTAGSWGTATAIPAIAEAADRLLAELGPDPLAALSSRDLDHYEVEIERRAPGQPAEASNALRNGRPAIFGPTYDGFVSYSYIAHFAEVHIEPTTRRIRVPRVVSVVDCGRVISPRTAKSQVMGGVVWGIGATLREETEVDARYGGFLNADIAEYVVPVNADVGRTEVAFLDEPDTMLNATGVKGLGEVVMTGVGAALLNAIWHATGKRLRNLPVRMENIL